METNLFNFHQRARKTGTIREYTAQSLEGVYVHVPTCVRICEESATEGERVSGQ